MKIDKIVLNEEKTNEMNNELKTVEFENDGFLKKIWNGVKTVVTHPVTKVIGIAAISFGGGYITKTIVDDVRSYSESDLIDVPVEEIETEIEPEEVKVEI